MQMFIVPCNSGAARVDIVQRHPMGEQCLLTFALVLVCGTCVHLSRLSVLICEAKLNHRQK